MPLIYGDMYHQDKYVRERFRLYRELLSRYFKKGTKILDIGGYTGDLLEILPKDINYTVIDVDQEALKIAQKRGARIINLDLEKTSLPTNEKFDIIVAAEILEHIRDPEKTLIQAKKILKNKGVILISLPNECTIYHRLKIMMGKGINGLAFSPDYHLHFPAIEQSRKLVGTHLRIKETKYWVHLGQGAMEKWLSVVPYSFWSLLTKLSPGLFSRGVIFLGTKK